VDFLSFTVGILAADQLLLTAGTGYVIYRYVYQPWKVMRADIQALHTALGDFKREMAMEIKNRQAVFLNDQAVAAVESKQRRTRWLSDAEISA
jgi:hypothetical protein